MTKKFTLDKFKLFWQSNPVLIIDSNGWLDLYRFSPRTTKKVLEIFEIIQLEDHWLPAQVYKEFNNNKETYFLLIWLVRMNKDNHPGHKMTPSDQDNMYEREQPTHL